jgi:myo-inositol-1(or 4)-monophosphatase
MQPLLLTALQAADVATAVHRRDFGAGLGGATEKARADYVSKTDLDAQQAALAIIQARHPDHMILAEESDEPVQAQLSRWDGRPLWIVDPLDGTANYLHGHPMYAASVAVWVEGRPEVGVVAHGSSGERWWAARGQGAYKNGRRISVSEPRPLLQALVGTGFPFKRLELLPRYLGQLERVLKSASGIRRAGSAALDLAYVAEGALDAFWEETLMPWDVAAGVVLIREAGGVVTGADGAEPGLTEGPLRAASGQELLDALEDALAGDGLDV